MSGETKKQRQLSRSRSISARSDWDASSTDGEKELLSRSSSIGYLNKEDLKQREAWDQHVMKYVSKKMERLKAGAMDAVLGDELEA